MAYIYCFLLLERVIRASGPPPPQKKKTGKRKTKLNERTAFCSCVTFKSAFHISA